MDQAILAELCARDYDLLLLGGDYTWAGTGTRETVADLAEDIEGLAHVNYVADPEEWMVLLRTPDNWRVLLPIAPEDERSEGEFTEDNILLAANKEASD